MPNLTYSKSIKALKYGRHDHWVMAVKINKLATHSIIDTGCNVPIVISPQLFSLLGIDYKKQSDKKVGTAGGHADYKLIKKVTLKIAGQSLAINNAISMEMTSVFTKKYQCIIGLPLMRKLKMLLDIEKRRILFK